METKNRQAARIGSAAAGYLMEKGACRLIHAAEKAGDAVLLCDALHAANLMVQAAVLEDQDEPHRPRVLSALSKARRGLRAEIEGDEGRAGKLLSEAATLVEGWE